MSIATLLVMSSALAVTPAAPEQPRLFAPGVVSTGQEEFGVTLTPDGKSVYFNRADPSRSTLQVILVSHWRQGRWTRPEVAPFSGRWRDIDPALSLDGRRLFFSSNRPHQPVSPDERYLIFAS